MATAEDLVRINGQAHEILKRVANGSLEAGSVRKTLQSIIEGRLSYGFEDSRVAARVTVPDGMVFVIQRNNGYAAYGQGQTLVTTRTPHELREGEHVKVRFLGRVHRVVNSGGAPSLRS